MGSGNLIIQARTAENAVPLSGVKITIRDYNGNILYQLITDENGDTNAVTLKAVDRSLSLKKDYTGMPYTIYDLEAEAEGFNRLFIYGVHIFDGETAFQPAALVPMLQAQNIPVNDEIFLGKHAVEMREPREQVGPIIEPSILRQVTIPNPITVHLGRPAASAVNVQVSFPDYVKNVASSEIYPTWPKSSLEANIYAIITFALNRVFTEWYRSRGYNFDITNSTAYDQYFVYGRTIYESISKIVDNIFNQYVIREGHIAPYFTSFCNGTTVSCSGMSQWGTVTLAEQGLTSIQILRNYYPSDIEIAETDVITDVIVSYPGTALRFGSTGLDVQTIQTYLNRIRRNYPAIPPITDQPGVFGSSTQAAVKKFQSIFNLTSDGIVGKATWNKISNIYTAVAKLAELTSEGSALGIGTVPPNIVLKWGTRGIDVVTLQYMISFISEYYPTIPQLMQNGIFDNQTYQAVIAFQQMMGLSADGIVGPATWDALYDIYWGIKENAPGTGVIEYVVQSGDSLWLLAKKFNTTINAIKTLNNLTGDVIEIGQVLKIPNTETTPPGFSYTVRPGDTLWLLAQRFHTTIDAIKSLNNLTGDVIDVGQVLQIPSTKTTMGFTTSCCTYIVKCGDTLESIAENHHTTADTIRVLNCLKCDDLCPGFTLLICN